MTRQQHYLFSHGKFLREFQKSSHELFSKLLSESGETYLYQLWQETATEFNLEGDDCVEFSGLKFIARQYEEYDIVLFEMPPPKKVGESYFIGIWMGNSYRYDRRSSCYYTLDLREDLPQKLNRSPATAFLGWKDSQSGVEHDRNLSPVLELFVNAIRKINDDDYQPGAKVSYTSRTLGSCRSDREENSDQSSSSSFPVSAQLSQTLWPPGMDEYDLLAMGISSQPVQSQTVTNSRPLGLDEFEKLIEAKQQTDQLVSIKSQATPSNLGNLVDEYVPRSRRKVLRAIYSLAVKPIILIGLFGLMMNWLIPEFSFWIFCLFPLIILLGGLGLYILVYEQWKFRLSLYERGAIAQINHRQYIAAYEDIKVYKGKHVLHNKGDKGLTPTWYRLQFPDGFMRQIYILYYLDYLALVQISELILQYNHQRCFTKSLNALNAGENIEFETLVLNKDGLKFSGIKFLWSDGYIVEFSYFLSDLSSGMFIIKHPNGGFKSKKARIHYSSIPNAPVFISLLKQLNKIHIVNF